MLYQALTHQTSTLSSARKLNFTNQRPNLGKTEKHINTITKGKNTNN